MKSTFKWILAGTLALAAVPAPSGAASLLGGLLKTGADSGNSSDLVTTSPGSGGNSIGLLGSNGVSLNLGGLTGGGTSLPSNLGVPGVAEVETSNGGGGTNAGLSLLGGGGKTLAVNPGGLLGSGDGLNVTLPGLPLSDGLPLGGELLGPTGGGSPTDPDPVVVVTGTGGGTTTGGYPVPGYYSGTTGNSFAIPDGLSPRLRELLKVLQDRDWLRVSNGQAVCLRTFGTAEVSGWLPRRDWPAFQQALTGYSQDIYALRQLLANCRSPAQRQALDLNALNRVIALDLRPDGTPVLFML